jgi:hypothetical protein
MPEKFRQGLAERQIKVDFTVGALEAHSFDPESAFRFLVEQ